MWNPHAAHGARMGQLLLVVAFTDGDYQRLEGEGRAFSLRDSDSIHRKNGGSSMKSIEKLCLNGFDHHKWWFQ